MEIFFSGDNVVFQDEIESLKVDVVVLEVEGVNKIIVLNYVGLVKDFEIVVVVSGIDVVVGGYLYMFLFNIFDCVVGVYLIMVGVVLVV